MATPSLFCIPWCLTGPSEYPVWSPVESPSPVALLPAAIAPRKSAVGGYLSSTSPTYTCFRPKKNTREPSCT